MVSLDETRFLGIYLRGRKGSNYIIKHLKESITEFNRQLTYKKITSSLHTYLANRVLIPKLEYLHQIAIINESKLSNLYRSVTQHSKKAAGLLRMVNNNIIHHIGFYNLTSLSDN